MANRNFLSQRLYTGHAMPVMIDCNFIVDDTEGDGISNLKGPYVDSVYMNSDTPSDENPNPAAGIIMVNLTDKFSRSFISFSGSIAPVTGLDLTASVIAVPNVITDLGTATQAEWEAVGFPQGVAPQVGMAFIPSSSATIGGAATVKLVGSSGILKIESVGSEDLAVSAKIPLLFKCLDASGALAAPAAGSIISLKMYLSNSSVIVAGE